MNSLPSAVLAALAAPVVIGRVDADAARRPPPAVRGRDRPARRPAAGRVRVLLRGRRACGRRGCSPLPPAAFAAARFARDARAAAGAGRGGRGGTGRGVVAGVRPGALVRGAERVPAGARRAATGAALLPRPLRRDRAGAARSTWPAIRPGCCWPCTRSGSTSPARMAALCIGVGALSAPAHLRPRRASCSTSGGARVAGAAAGVRAGGADVRRHVGRRRLPARSACSPRGRSPRASWRARLGAVAARRRRRCSRGRCWRSARGRRSSPGGATGVRAALALSALCGVALLAFYAARYARHADSTRSARCARPRTSTARASPRCGRTGTGCSARRSAFLLVLGLPISWLRAARARRAARRRRSRSSPCSPSPP